MHTCLHKGKQAQHRTEQKASIHKMLTSQPRDFYSVYKDCFPALCVDNVSGFRNVSRRKKQSSVMRKREQRKRREKRAKWEKEEEAAALAAT